MPKKVIPKDQHITYQLQFRKCGKTACSTCRNTVGHGPYWYAYWRVGSKLISGYIGKVHPNKQQELVPSAISAIAQKTAQITAGEHIESEREVVAAAV